MTVTTIILVEIATKYILSFTLNWMICIFILKLKTTNIIKFKLHNINVMTRSNGYVNINVDDSYPTGNSSYKVCKLSKVMRLIFYFQKFLFFSNINVIPFKTVPLGSYTPMETLYPLLVAALEVFNWYGLQVKIKKKTSVLIFLTESPMSNISLVV